MKFLVDAQLPPALARWLTASGHDAQHVGDFTASGHDAQHVGDLGLLEAGDEEIWELAASNGSVIVTKDEDFSIQKTLRPEGPRIVWVRLGNCRTQALLNWFEGVLPHLESLLASGESLIELS